MPAIGYLDIECIHLEDSSVTLYVRKLGKHLNTLKFSDDTPDDKLYVVSGKKAYIKHTEEIRGKETQLFISYVKPFRAVSKDTVSSWIKTVMHMAGVYTNIFKPHSMSSAA